MAHRIVLLFLVIFSLAELAILSTGHNAKNNGHAEYEILHNIMGDSKNLLQKTLSDPTATFTCLLFLVAIGQAGLFYWQLRLISKGSVDTKNAANAAVEQTKLVKEQFIASHRPRLVLRRAELRRFCDDMPIVVFVKIVNVGQTKAVSAMWNCDVIIVDPGKNIHGLSRFRRPPHPLRDIASGDFVDTMFEDDVAIPKHQAGDVRQGIQEVLFYGEIAYNDQVGTVRRTGFVRRYDYVLERFCRTDDPDNEYED